MLDFLQLAFMQKAVVAGLLISVLAPMVGMFLVVRRYSLMVDTLSHVSLLGIAVGLLLNLNAYIVSVVFAVLASFGIEKVRQVSKLYQESILAMFLSGSLAIAVIIISASSGFNVNLFSLLFGSIITVSNTELILMGLLSTVVISTILVSYKQLFLISFDEDLAKSSGLNLNFYNLLLIVLAAITVSLSIRIVGVLLISALMVIPVISAMQYKLSFKLTNLLSLIFSMTAVLTGIIISYHVGWATGGTIVVVALVIFALSLILNKVFRKV